MLESFTASPGLWIVVAAVLAAGLGFAIGRIGGAAARRTRALQVALAEERAAHDRARKDYEGYRKQVADHFSETSERLHDLTLQYRAVYEHLAEGATELCPEGFSKLEGGLGLDALPEEVAQRPVSGDVAQRPAASTAAGQAARPPESPTPH
jgi:uncharacterized membrane-anchored protein YhcB (DUF1043 family)